MLSPPDTNLRSSRSHMPGSGLLGATEATDCGGDMIDPARNRWFSLRPVWAFGLDEDDFTGPPTRWTFEAPEIQSVELRPLDIRPAGPGT